VFGWVLAFQLGLQALTGIALACFYAPSTTDAWASVAYIQDQAVWGWLVRGLHVHGASAMVIVAGVHLLQTAVYGAYRRPRQVTWWLGLGLLALILAFTITGYVLRWDQDGYWANQVEIGIAASTPVVGDLIRRLAQGGNAYGNLTLTRFYALHTMALPGLVAVVTVVHVRRARQAGATPRWGREGAPATPAWPGQTLRDVTAMAAVFAILLGYVISQGGAGLGAPADPASAYDARPLWYFRWLFELRHLFGSLERVAALGVPAIVGGFLVALPLLDRGATTEPRRRLPLLAGVAALFVAIGALTMMSFAADDGDAALAKRAHLDEARAARARALAKTYGVPATGALDVFTTVPMWRARSIYARACKGCHDEASDKRKGPVIGPGFGDRAWLRAFLKAPGGDRFWGRTKLAKTDAAMKAVELGAADLDDLVEALYAETGAADVDLARRTRGVKLFEACADCHSLDDGVAGTSGPGLGGLGSRDHFTSYIGNPGRAVHLGDKHEMPRFDHELGIVDRDAVAAYLVWLRTATPGDLAALPSL
jgi:ubiquinol-cytochrome c reductase cytochrome b subunit